MCYYRLKRPGVNKDTTRNNQQSESINSQPPLDMSSDGSQHVMLKAIPPANEEITNWLTDPAQSPLTSTATTSKYPTKPPTIALTFDDGPDPTYTPKVLAILKEHNIRATFFCIGQQVEEHSDLKLVQQAFKQGHAIGNHTWTHADLTKLSASQIDKELTSTSTAIRNAIGVSPKVYRPPFGATNQLVVQRAKKLGMKEELWKIDPKDWELPASSSKIVATVLREAASGKVILLHDGGGDRSQTVVALPSILSGLKARGFKFVTL